MAPLFRNDQIGSLIRPASLIKARSERGIYTDALSDDLKAQTQAAISSVVQKQLELGVRPITSGEYERTIFYSNFFENLGGIERRSGLRIPDDVRKGLPTWDGLLKIGYTTREACVATGRIQHVESPNLPAWEMLKAATPKERWADCKISLPSIVWEHLQLPRGGAWAPTSPYTSDREYLADMAAAYRRELQVLYDSGLRSVQIDDPNLTYFVHEAFREALRADGVDPDELLDLYVWAHNEAIRDRPADLHVGIHLCRGNLPGPKGSGFVAGSYEPIAERVLARLHHDTLYLEFDNELSGSFESLRFLPRGKNVVLGLVTTKQPDMEDLETLVGRVHEAAAVIAAGQGRSTEEVLADTLAVSPQCGFASFAYNKGVGTEEKMWEKLTLVRDVARTIWGAEM
ncbi:hypothetical protein BD289DRAFT_437808 [Coniella lustricola]|uniref:Cobalamin-independent methionine synthase MetE C-terminal/archaeal domain-containing protein n=1 Tax=Coniella lustricola TaxID=2025994 RepID=A0A2T3A3Q1_9PEZI|nr:hypothetical protein BD289DRAFT_437808 [Coniella lustricola]